MITVRLLGGMGNQMFQYAAGLCLAVRRNTELLIDASPLGMTLYTPRAYALDCFSIGERVAGRPRFFPLSRRANRVRNRLARWRGRANPAGEHLAPERACTDPDGAGVLQEHSTAFDPRVIDAPDGTCLNGFWQSEKYFADEAGLVRSRFAFRRPPSPSCLALLRETGACESVSLHVRRGDYVSTNFGRQVMGALPVEYYREAMDRMRSLVRNARFFVFSDDVEWCRANLPRNGELVFVETASAAADLRLMSACRHHVVANSSFSWWGAWLDPSPSKVVIAPRRWFADPSMDARDLLPEKWLAI